MTILPVEPQDDEENDEEVDDTQDDGEVEDEGDVAESMNSFSRGPKELEVAANLDISNMTTWNNWAPTQTTVSYQGGVNTVTFTTDGHWESLSTNAIYLEAGKTYKLTFDYQVVNSFQHIADVNQAGQYFGGMGFRVLNSQSSDGSSDEPRTIAYYTLNNTAMSSMASAELVFTATTTPVYVSFNGGFIKDGTTTTFKVQNVRIEAEVACEDWFIDSSNNRKTKLGNCGANKSYVYGATARGSDWGSARSNNIGGVYYSYYEYSSDTSLSVTAPGTVYRYFKGYTNINFLDPKYVEHPYDSELGSFSISYNGGDYYLSRTNDAQNEFLAYGEPIRIKDINFNDSYVLGSVYYNNAWFGPGQGGTEIVGSNGIYQYDVQGGGRSVYIKADYKINYIGVGGAVNNNPQGYSPDTETFTLQDPVKAGYTFLGWTGEGITTPTKNVSIQKGSEGAKTYTANWVTNYTVSCEDWFVDSNYNRRVKLGDCGESKSYAAGTTARGSDWGLSTSNGYNGDYYAGYLYYDSTAITVQSNTTVYRYFKAWTNINVLNPQNSEVTNGSIASFEVSYDGGSTYTRQNDQSTVYQFYGETVKIRGIQNTSDYLLSRVCYGDGFFPTRDGVCNTTMTPDGNGVYTYNVIEGGDCIELQNGYAVSCEDWFVDSSFNRKVKLGNCGSAKPYFHGATAKGSDWGTSHNPGTFAGQWNYPNYVYYMYYDYKDTSTQSVTSAGTVYRYFGAWTNLDINDPNGAELQSTVGSLKISYDGGSSFTTVYDQIETYPYYGTNIVMKDIQLTEGYSLRKVCYGSPLHPTRMGGTCTEIVPSNGLYIYTLTTGGNGIEIQTDYTEYYILYNLNGGLASNPASYTIVTNTFTLNNPTNKEGYTFRGWIGSNGDTPQTTVSISKGSYGNKSYTALWNPINYSISYDLAGGSASSNPTIYNIETNTFTLNNPTREGYTFRGWIGSNGSTPQTTVSIAKGSHGDKSYTAVWNPTDYEITYELAGGSVTSNPVSYTIETATFTLNNPTRANSTFAGWIGSNGDIPQTEVTITKGTHEDLNYTATWTCNTGYEPNGNKCDPKDYSISYILHGGNLPSGTPNPKTYTVESDTFQLPTPTRVGYIFEGWKIQGAADSTASTSISIAHGTHENRTYEAVWTPITYIISFEANGGDDTLNPVNGTMTSQTVTYDADDTLKAMGFTRDGYTFLGWTENQNGQGTKYQPGDTLPNLRETQGASVTFYAQWSANNTTTYKVIHKLQDKTDTTLYNVDEEETKTGITYEYTDSEPKTTYRGFRVPVSQSERIKGDNSTTIVYNYDRDTYTLSYNTNEGEQTYPDITRYYQQTLGTLPSPTREGYIFSGWYTVNDDSHLTPTLSNDIRVYHYIASSEMPYENITLVANWVPVTYNIIFRSNGADQGVTDDINYEATYDHEIDLSDRGHRRLGYTWEGWNTQENGLGTHYDEDESGVMNLANTLGATVDLYSQWRVHSYTIHFNKGENGVGTMDDQIFTYDQLMSLSDNSFTRVGYHFTGWALSAEDAINTSSHPAVIAYTDGQSVKNLKSDDGDELTLYAVWEPNTHTKYVIQYAQEQLNGTYAVVSADTQELYGTSDSYVTAPVLQYPGFVTPTEVEIQISPDGSKVHTYNYARKDITLSFNTVGGSYIADITGKYGATVDKPANPTKDGYSFGGWNETVASTFPTENKTYIAQWNLVTYDIDYDFDGGNDYNANPRTYTIESSDINLSYPSKLGYTFLGWNGTALTQTTKDVTILAGSFGDREYTAQWSANQYEVRFHANGGEGSMENESMIYNFPKNLTSNGFTRAGYTFLGWNTNSNSTTALYSGGQSVVNLASNQGDMVDLYAIWQANPDTPYTVYYYLENVNDDNYTLDSTDDTKVGTTDSTVMIENLKKDITGAHFEKASLVINPQSTDEVDRFTIDGHGNTKVYLFYKRNTHTVTVTAGEGVGSVSGAGTYKYGQTVTLNPQDVDSCYTASPIIFTMGDEGVQETLNGVIKKFTVTLNKDSHISSVQGDGEYNCGVDVTVRATPEVGYEFVKWNKNSTQVSTQSSYTFTINESVVLNAVSKAQNGILYTVRHWMKDVGANTYSKYAEEQKSGETDSPITLENEKISVPCGTYAEGKENGTVKTTTTIKGDGSTVIDLYYSRNSFMVNTSKDSGIQSVSNSASHECGADVTITATPKIGYHFTTYSSTDVASSTDNPYTFTMPNKAVLIQAQSNANTYTVNFNANGGIGTMSQQVFTYDISQQLSDNLFTKQGYIFTGWSTNSNATAPTYTNRQEVDNLVTTGSITLYAVWTTKGTSTKYTVRHIKQGLSTPTDDEVIPDELYAETNSVQTPAVNTYEGFNSPSAGNITVSANGNASIDYVYTRKNITLTFNADNSLANTSVSGKFEAVVTKPANPRKTGYTFSSWSPVIPDTFPAMSGTHVAQYTLDTYTITYNLNSGTNHSDNPANYTYLSSNITLKEPTRYDYVFIGWEGTDIVGISKNVTILAHSVGNRIYTAIWAEDKNHDGIDDATQPRYTVRYTDGVEGEEVFADQITSELLSGFATPLFVGTPTREDYIFAGWMPVVSDKVIGNQTYTATWYEDFNHDGENDDIEAKYTLTIHYEYSRGGKVSPSYITGGLLSGTVYSVPSPSKNNYRADKDVVRGIITGNTTIVVKYYPNHDKNNNGIADEEDGSNSSGGGGRKNTTTDTHGSADNNSSQDNNVGSKLDGKTSTQPSQSQNIVVPVNSSFTNEQVRAFKFAHDNGITTMSTIEKAKMNSPLTRIQMAKMLSYYAINVMKQQPDTSKGIVKFNDVTNKMNKQYDDAVTLAYQLGIMGINMKNNEFRPNDQVTRAEFVTALSRLLYHTSDGQYKQSSKYYEPHMNKLFKEGIVSNTDPKMKEKRGYVMIMLMRSAQKG